jgi:hypothetical protein
MIWYPLVALAAQGKPTQEETAREMGLSAAIPALRRHHRRIEAQALS